MPQMMVFRESLKEDPASVIIHHHMSRRILCQPGSAHTPTYIHLNSHTNHDPQTKRTKCILAHLPRIISLYTDNNNKWYIRKNKDHTHLHRKLDWKREIHTTAYLLPYRVCEYFFSIFSAALGDGNGLHYKVK